MCFKYVIKKVVCVCVCVFKPFHSFLAEYDGSIWIPFCVFSQRLRSFCLQRRRVLGFVAGSLGLLQLRRLVLGGLRQGRAELPAGGPGDGLRLGSGGVGSLMAVFGFIR